MNKREEQFYLRTAESVRREGGEVTRLYATTASGPVLVFSSKNRADVVRVRDRILASLDWSDLAAHNAKMVAALPLLNGTEEWEI